MKENSSVDIWEYITSKKIFNRLSTERIETIQYNKNVAAGKGPFKNTSRKFRQILVPPSQLSRSVTRPEKNELHLREVTKRPSEKKELNIDRGHFFKFFCTNQNTLVVKNELGWRVN